MNKIYLICAAAGSYYNEDRSEWIVCAYATLEQAERHAALARRRAARLELAQRLWRELRLNTSLEDSATYIDGWGGPRDGANPYDPDMQLKDHLTYSVVEMDVLSTLSRLKV